jgi:hypothetical protein
MIKKFLATFAVVTATGCTSLGGLSPSTIALVDQIQAGAIKACGYLPIVESVAAILSAGASTAVDPIITALCAQIPPAPVSAARGAAAHSATPTDVIVGNVVVHGTVFR